MQYVRNGTGLRFVLVGGSSHFLSRPLDGSVGSQTGIVGQWRESSQVAVRNIWAFHSWVCIYDLLLLARPPRVNRIIVFKSRSRLPCFTSSWSLVPSHVFLGETLLYGLRLPIIVSDLSSVFNHPSPKLAKHGLCSDDSDLPRSVRIREYLLMY